MSDAKQKQACREALTRRALDALKNHQRQLDPDGIMVGVSRQALDELITAYEARQRPDLGAVREALVVLDAVNVAITNTLESVFDQSEMLARLQQRVQEAARNLALLTTPQAQGWRQITEEMSGKKIAVTNNINARNAHGEMSHVWLVDVELGKDGEFVAFNGNNRIYGLTHYADCLPAAPEPQAQEGE